MNRIVQFVRRNIQELRDDPVVRLYGWAILAGHAVVWLFFVDTGILLSLTHQSEPFCWPFFEDCYKYRLRSAGHAFTIQTAYLALGLASGAALTKSWIKSYWLGVALMNVLLIAVISLDYRLRANEFYMLLWTNGTFLLLPGRRWTIPIVILSFYWWAGRLKLNHEWLSGSVLYRDLFLIPPSYFWLACTYVVVLEMMLIWGLLARHRAVRWMVLAQLALFHIQSLSQIHWFYPALMAAILSWFALDQWRGNVADRASLNTFMRGKAPGIAYVVLAVFGLFQLTPFLYRGDAALTGQGRIFSLHMFEARQRCDVTAAVLSSDGSTGVVNLKLEHLSPRMICDPIVYYNRAQNICRSGANDETFVDLHFTMRAKRTTDERLQTIIDAPNFCRSGHRYAVFTNNSWMQ